MGTDDPLNRFIRDALAAGRSREAIRGVLVQAGWSPREADTALAGFAALDFTPPVPRPRPQLTARDAFVYLLLFTALAFVAGHLITLVHAILDLALPDPGASGWAEAAAIGRIRWSVSTLVVTTPVFVWMTLRTRRELAEDAGRRRSLVRKWLTYLALFVAALVFFGDAVFVLYSFLTGEATPRFLLKALTVACVAGAVFAVYLRDAGADADEQ